MPRAIEQKARVRPNDSTLIEAMEAMIEHLGQLEKEALGMAIALDLERDEEVAELLSASSYRLPAPSLPRV